MRKNQDAELVWIQRIVRTELENSLIVLVDELDQVLSMLDQFAESADAEFPHIARNHSNPVRRRGIQPLEDLVIASVG